LRKAQEGENFQGPVTQEASNRINKEYTRNTGVGPRVYDQKVKDADELKRLRENYDRIPKEVSDEYKRGGAMKKMQAGGIARPKTTTATNKFPGSGKPTKEAINNINRKPKKMQKGGLQKAATKRRTIEGGTIKKMMTGGMVNPNSSVSAQKTAGSKGVQSGVNPKASSSKVAGSRGSGKVNTPPSKAVPTAKRGGMVKKKR